MISDSLSINSFSVRCRSYGFKPRPVRASAFVRPHARYQPFGSGEITYVSAWTPLLFQLDLQTIWPKINRLSCQTLQRFIDTRLELTQTVEFLKQALLEIFEIQRQLSLADGVAFTDKLFLHLQVGDTKSGIYNVFDVRDGFPYV